MNNKFKIYTLGCKVNQYDSMNLSRLLCQASLKAVNNGADVAIINSCAVTKTAISKGQRMINKAKKENPRAKIILMGCWSQVYDKEINQSQIDLMWGVGKHQELVEKILGRLLKSEPSSLCSKTIDRIVHSDKSRYFIKIQDGCEQFCSYCIIPYARGKLKSRSENEILQEIKQVVKAGYREVVLCGIHSGLYKSKTKINLSSLLKEIIKIPKLGRVRLSSIEVTDVSDELINLILVNNKICNHLHIPLQSGNDKILKLMNRPYDKKFFVSKIRQIRRLIPNIALTTDVIVGFPRETKKDFKDTCDFIKLVGFSRLHVFPFSAHEKTPASKLSHQLNKREKLDRANKLRKIGYQLTKKYNDSLKTKEQNIIVEKVERNEIRGLNQYYFQVLCDKKNIIEAKEGIEVGKIIKIGF